MRQATILIMVLAAVGCAADDDDIDDEDLGESEAASAPTHNPDNCPGGGTQPDPASGGPWTRPIMLQRCTAACDGGQEAVEAFCRVLRDIRLRAACWAIAKGSAVACKGWCYWHWGK